MAHASMMPNIKCSSCGVEVNLMELGDHTCTRLSVEKIEEHPSEQPSSPEKSPEHSPDPSANTSPTSPVTLQVPPLAVRPSSRPTSPLQHEIPMEQDNEEPADEHAAEWETPEDRSEHMPDFDSLAPRALRLKPPPINSGTANGLGISSDPLTPADSPEQTESGTSDPYFKSSSTFGRNPAPPTPHSATMPTANNNFRPPSTDIQPGQQETSPTSWSRQDIQSPPFSETSSAPMSPQSMPSPSTSQLGLFPPLRPQMSKSSASLSDVMPMVERKQPEENRILNLFRKKSTKHISKKSISAPSLTKSTMPLENIPDLPRLPARIPPRLPPSLPPSLPTSPEAPESSRVDRDGKLLPTGPAPPRPARPATIIVDQLHANGVLPAGRPISPDEQPPPPPPFLESPSSQNKSLPAPPTPATPDKDLPPAPVPVPSSPDKELPPPPSRMESPALPQIPEDEPSQDECPPVIESQRVRSRSRSRSVSRSRAPSIPTRQPSPMTRTRVAPIDQLARQTAHTHSPTGSGSSHASQPVSESHTDGSVSTPPTSSPSSFVQWKSADDEAQTGAGAPVDTAAPAAARGAANFSRPRAATGSSSASGSISHVKGILHHSASTDNSISTQTHRNGESMSSSTSHRTSTLVTSPSEETSTEGGAESNASSFVRPRLPPIPDEEQRQHSRRPSVSRSGSLKSKGNCRGCGEAITGKSVKASDGHLTGRYHKDCFVCKTCREPFPTSDFYVIRDEPYCHTHYHVLNGSTCHGCNKGIEGQFLQIFPNRKFHAICFSCHDCRAPLSHDYFEMNGAFYCERDARRIFHSTRHLAPGRPMPERRTTNWIRA